MKQKGFTIIELMIVISVMGILATLAGPSFNQMIGNNRITTQTNQMILALQIARTEAVKRGRPVNVVATDGASWANGWQVQDENNVVLQDFEEVPAGLTLVSTNGYTSFQFDGSGTVNRTDTLTVCKTDLDGRNIMVTGTGRTRLINSGVSCS